MASTPPRPPSAPVLTPRKVTRGPLDDENKPTSSGIKNSEHSPVGALRLPHSGSGSSSPVATTPTSSRFPSATGSPAVSAAQPPRDFSKLLVPQNFQPLPVIDDVTATAAAAADEAAAGLSLSPEELLARGHFRAAATESARQLTMQTDPSDAAAVFPLLFVRLASLSLLRLAGVAATEAKLLLDQSFAALHRHPVTGAVLPAWQLRVLVVRLQAVGLRDWRRGMMAYYELAREARNHIADAAAAAADDDNDGRRWRARLRDLGVRVAGALVEIGDLRAAAAHLASLRDLTAEADAADAAEPESAHPAGANFESSADEPNLHEALLWLIIGDEAAAVANVGQMMSLKDAKSEIVAALRQMCDGHFDDAVASWNEILAASAELPGAGVSLVRQLLIVSLLHAGRDDEVQAILDSSADPNSTPRLSRALVLNIVTTYDLCSESARARKHNPSPKSMATEKS